VTEDVI